MMERKNEKVTRIVIERDNVKAKQFFEGAAARKEENRKRIEATFPPENIRKLMAEKVKEVNETNRGTLDVSTFSLGMTCMWMLLDKQGLINKNPT
jgi:hypothetical protein